MKNKKLDLYCKLFVVAVMVVFFSNGLFVNLSDTANYDDKLEFAPHPDGFYHIATRPDGSTARCDNDRVSLEVAVRPKHNQANDSTVLVSHSNGQTYIVEMQNVKLYMPLSHSDISIWIALVVWLPIVVLSIFGAWQFPKLLVMIRSGEIFFEDFAKLLKKLGIIGVVLYLVEFVGYYFIMHYISSHVYMANYEIVCENVAHSYLLFGGIILLMASEIILIGKHMREEQDLTI